MDRTNVQWDRVGAFLSGVGVLVLYLWMSPYDYLPDTIATLFISIPTALVFYGLSQQTGRRSFRLAVGVTIGLAASMYFSDFI